MPDDHSKVVPLLPIPNRTVKRLCADDSAGSRVKVGHRQASIEAKAPLAVGGRGFVFHKECGPLLDVVKLFKELTRRQKLVYTARLR